MFLNMGVYRRLITKAYKGVGLSVENTGRELVISNNSWCIEILAGMITKKAKSILIELIGELPAAGQAFEYHEKEPTQSLVPGSLYIYLIERFDKSTEEFEGTNLYMTDKYGDMRQMIQNKVSGEKKLLAAVFMNLVDASKIDEENAEEAPYIPRKNDNMLIWINDRMAFACPLYAPETDQEKHLLNITENMRW